jgi:hypothetical protein
MKLFHEQPLARKIAIVTAIKLAGLLAIWWIFFSGSDSTLTPEQVSSALLRPQTHNTTTP